MALVFAQNEETESGHAYADVLGERYEYPVMYRRLIRPGERFVYYRGRRQAGGGRQAQVYLGTGVVGRISPSPNAGRLVCEVEDFVRFPVPAGFKDEDGYLERGAEGRARPGGYFQRGVRRIDDETFLRILRAAEAAAAEQGSLEGSSDGDTVVDTDPAGDGRGTSRAGPGSYPDPATARAVDRRAVAAAKAWAAARWPGADVDEMPHNNPGYDLEVHRQGQLERYIEVKGTLKPVPEYHLSEGQRLFSLEFSERFTLVVVYDIALAGVRETVLHRDGAIEQSSTLRPSHWIGLVDAQR